MLSAWSKASNDLVPINSDMYTYGNGKTSIKMRNPVSHYNAIVRTFRFHYSWS